MKRKLQCLSCGVALFTVIASCGKETGVEGMAGSNPNQPPPVTTTRCDNSTRASVPSQLTAIGRLSQERYGMSVANIGNKILFAGGEKAGLSYVSSRVDIYDVVTKTWSRAELSQARSHMATVTAGSKVFFAGGQLDNKTSLTTYATVDIYDVNTRAWSVVRLSEARTHVAAAVVGDKVMFAGGEKAPFTTSAVVDVYDLATGGWSVMHLSEARCFLSAVALNNKIYFAGGLKPRGSSGFEASGRIDIYDNATKPGQLKTRH